MGCPTSNDRFASARGLLDFGFANYQSIAPPKLDKELTPVPVLRGVEESVMPIYDDPGKFVIEKGQEKQLVQEVTLVEDLEAPVITGQVVGKVQVLVNGEIQGQYDLKAGCEVARMTFGKAFGKLFKSMLRMGHDESSAKIKEHSTTIDEKSDTKAEASESTKEKTAEKEQPSAEDPCPCGMDKCYCKQIGDICGCTKKK